MSTKTEALWCSVSRELIFSLKHDDKTLSWEYFRVGGAGGQHRDKTSAGVRVSHRPSGATATATDTRSQLHNRKNAFKRMTETVAFKLWLARVTTGGPTPEELVERDMNPKNLVIEGRVDGDWAPLV